MDLRQASSTTASRTRYYRIARLYDQLVVYLVGQRADRLEEPIVRQRLAELKLDILEHRALAEESSFDDDFVLHVPSPNR